MSSMLLEVTRASHEKIERLELLIVKDLQTEPATNKDRFHQSHRVRNVIEKILESTHKLITSISVFCLILLFNWLGTRGVDILLFNWLGFFGVFWDDFLIFPGVWGGGANPRQGTVLSPGVAFSSGGGAGVP
nr:splicing factor SF3a60 homolog [Ipomoea batatas]